MSRIGALAVLPLAALPAPAAAQDAVARPAGPLTLECQGVAARRDAGTLRGRSARTGRTRAAATADQDGGAETATATHGQGIAVRFVFEIDGDHGRVRYPAALLPVVHSGGDAAGWWPIRDLDARDDAFGGRIALNLLNKPRFTIDRRTGAFDLSGGIDPAITGRCAKASDAPRLF